MVASHDLLAFPSIASIISSFFGDLLTPYRPRLPLLATGLDLFVFFLPRLGPLPFCGGGGSFF